MDISRKAELYETSSGMITITGGKLTTWRRMAKMAVDRLVERDARDAPCRTHEIPLGFAISADDLPRVEGVPESAYEQLAGRYGHAAHDVLRIAAERGELAQPVVADGPCDLLAEVVHAARKEQARNVGDALLRRTRLGLTAARQVAQDSGVTAERVARAMAPELGGTRRASRRRSSAFWTRRARRASSPRRDPVETWRRGRNSRAARRLQPRNRHAATDARDGLRPTSTPNHRPIWSTTRTCHAEPYPP